MQSDTTATPTSTALAVDIRRFPWIRRFAADYAFAFDRVRDFFAGNPADSGASCLWRGGRVEQAREVFADLLSRYPQRQEEIAAAQADLSS